MGTRTEDVEARRRASIIAVIATAFLGNMGYSVVIPSLYSYVETFPVSAKHVTLFYTLTLSAFGAGRSSPHLSGAVGGTFDYPSVFPWNGPGVAPSNDAHSSPGDLKAPLFAE
jgi:hypothetical protein